jgi:predicted HAD superfamily Cof-like phosphohydrolase
MKNSHLSTAQEMVRQFMSATGQATPDKPGFPPQDVIDLRHELTREENKEWEEADAARDIVGVADSFADRLYVLLGDCVAYGIEIEDVFDEVQRSNMTKVIDGSFRADGKYLKGPSYEPPNIAPIIAHQIDYDVGYCSKCKSMWEENESKQ